MEIKKITKYDGKLKGCHFEQGVLIDENGSEINLNEILLKAYGENYFDISTTTKTEEIIDLDQVDEIQDLDNEE